MNFHSVIMGIVIRLICSTKLSRLGDFQIKTHTQSVSAQTRKNNKQTASTTTTATTMKQVTTIHSVIYNLKLFDLRGVRK